MADLIPGIPGELLKPAAVDPERRVLLKAAEVERGMGTGRPSVLLRAIYKQAPEFFTSEVLATDLREVVLPFTKVVEQFATFQVRDDQITDQEYPQLQTPFLQVTLEDSERLGKPATPPAAQEIPAARPEAVAPAKPAVVAAAPPAADAAPKPNAPIRFTAPPATSTPAPAPTTKAPPSLDQKPAVVGATPPAAGTAPKANAPIRFSPPILDSTPAPAPTVKAPPSLDQTPPVVTAAPPTADAAPKTNAPIRPSAAESASAQAPAPAANGPLPLDQTPPGSPTAAKISPNGTGAPAAERVPASSGSPVPTPLPSPLAPLPPTRIPFKVSPPSNDLRKESKFPALRTNPDAANLSDSGPRISLPLRNILRNVAPFQLSGPIDTVPDTALIEIPFSIVQPQLSLGRVAISAAQFQAALPEEYRALFKADASGTPVPLSLQDVLQNLPNESLQLRGDQEEPEVGVAFETPFSQKASEDATRMKVPADPIAKTIAAAPQAAPEPAAAPAEAVPKPAAPAAAPTAKAAPASAEPTVKMAGPPPKEAPIDSAKPVPVELAKETPQPAAAPKQPVAKPATDTPEAAAPTRRTALQNVLDTDEPLDAKSVVGHVSRLPGVSACAIVFSDGLSLAGNVPAEYEADALCAMAPSIIKRVGEQISGAKFGALSGLTLFCAKAPVSLFAHDNICLAAIHSDGEIAAEVRDRLGRTTQELARMYTQPA